ncbi:MAG: hypothetical protein ACREGI_00685, partial [Candidatus Levyibacteriota bacterium]
MTIFAKKKREQFFWIFVVVLGICMTLPISHFIWKNIRMLQFFQFPWRFIALASFAGLMLVSWIFSKLQTKYIVVLTCIIIATLVGFIKVSGYTTVHDSYFQHFSGTTYFHGEGTTIWTAGDPGNFPSSPILYINGDGTIANLKERSNLHTFTANNQTATEIVDNTIYFPGWKVTVDGKKVPIQFQDHTYRGFIVFPITKGTHHIVVS